MTPAQHGRAVAMGIDAALSPKSETDGERMEGTHTTPMRHPSGDALEDAVTMNDHQGSTWEEIVGAANVSDKRIAVDGDGGGTKVVKAASVAGMTLTSMQPMRLRNGGCLTVRKKTIRYRCTRASPARCSARAVDCAVENVPDEDRDALVGAAVMGVKKLTGSWYFTPEDGDKWYVGTTTAGVTTYTAETLYAKFGHWLVDSNNDNNAEVMTYALTGGNTEWPRIDREHCSRRHRTDGYVGQLPRSRRRDVRVPDRQPGRHDQHDPIGCVHRHGQLGGDIRTSKTDTWRHRPRTSRATRPIRAGRSNFWRRASPTAP